MKRITAFLFIPLILLAHISVNAQPVKSAGSIEKISGSEIIVKYDNPNKPFAIGEKLFVAAGDKSIMLEVTYPMQTFAKCRIVNTASAKPHQLTRGMAAYRGKLPDKKEDDASLKNFLKDNGDGTITDTRSGLMWLKDTNHAGKKMNLKDAVAYCEDLDAAGYDDWYLPKRDDFKLLIKGLKEEENWIPVLSACGFTNLSDYYWINTEAMGTAGAFCLAIISAGKLGFNDISYTYGAWPVRKIK